MSQFAVFFAKLELPTDYMASSTPELNLQRVAKQDGAKPVSIGEGGKHKSSKYPPVGVYLIEEQLLAAIFAEVASVQPAAPSTRPKNLTPEQRVSRWAHMVKRATAIHQLCVARHRSSWQVPASTPTNDGSICSNSNRIFDGAHGASVNTMDEHDQNKVQPRSMPASICSNQEERENFAASLQPVPWKLLQPGVPLRVHFDAKL
eukprot:6487411-Amphidinium_carterae.2